MSIVLYYTENIPEESQPLLSLKYEQLKQLLEKVIELHSHNFLLIININSKYLKRLFLCTK